MATANSVNLDALIRRADLAEPGEAAEDISSLPVTQLGPKGLLYPALRKPDFQRETANWRPEQVADLISTFVRRDLIPSVILWRAGQHVFVIDGAHRLSALIAWVHDDFGDKEVSLAFFQGAIPHEQLWAAERTRELVNAEVGSYRDHQMAVEYPQNASEELAERARRIGWLEIPVQWIRNADHDKAEKSFFRINQGGTRIDPVESRILSSRRSALALASRAIVRGGTGHNYWEKFAKAAQDEIEGLGREIHSLLFKPRLALPIKTLDIPVAGAGYGPAVLPFVFDLVNLTNGSPAPEASSKKAVNLPDDPNGATTVEYLKRTRSVVQRLCSNHPSSLGLHPAVYFYSPTGVFQPSALLSFVELIAGWGTPQFFEFTYARREFEAFLLRHRNITEAIRRLGSGQRSRPRVVQFYRRILQRLAEGVSQEELTTEMENDPIFDLFLEAPFLMPPPAEDLGQKFSREMKGGAFLRAALASAPRCPTCSGLLHHNGMQTGHVHARREGGPARLENAQLQHPFCNSTVAQ